MIAIMLRFFAKIFIPSNHSNWCRCCCFYADGLAATSSLTQEEKENSFFLLHSHTHTHTLTWTHTHPHTHSLFHLSTFTRTSSLLIFSFLPKNNFLFDNFFSVCRDFCPSEGRPLEGASAQDFCYMRTKYFIAVTRLLMYFEPQHSNKVHLKGTDCARFKVSFR